jgi:hypothetical protein
MFRRSDAMRLFKNSALTYINVKRFASAADLEYACVLGGWGFVFEEEGR